jgi:glycopeptide antibiotics resistance protein
MDYIASSANPQIAPVYFPIAAIIAFLTAILTRYYNHKKKMSLTQSIALILLTTYIFLVFASTVFSRTPTDYYSYELLPFWSYRRIWQGSQGLFWEDVLNVIMLLPLGVLVPIVMKPANRKDSRVFRRVVLIGFFTSVTIELLQLILKRGLFEFDDMFHNTLGVAIGYWIYRIINGKKKMF